MYACSVTSQFPQYTLRDEQSQTGFTSAACGRAAAADWMHRAEHARHYHGEPGLRRLAGQAPVGRLVPRDLSWAPLIPGRFRLSGRPAHAAGSEPRHLRLLRRQQVRVIPFAVLGDDMSGNGLLSVSPLRSGLVVHDS